MNKTIEFLQTLNNYELAFLYYYKYNNYLPSSQKIIEIEIQNRNLSKEYLESIVKQYVISSSRPQYQCPRCGTDKLLSSKEPKKYTSRLEGIDSVISGRTNFVDKIECLVCGFILQDENQESDWLSWLKKILKRKNK